MKIITDDIQISLPPCVATIGCFDGVHRGHRYLVRQLCQVGEERRMPTALITFPVHPRQVMQADYQPQLLSCLPQKEALLQTLDADYCIMLPFTRQLSQLSAREFMALLRNRFNVRALVIGYDHRFGHNRSESFHDYCRYSTFLSRMALLRTTHVSRLLFLQSSIFSTMVHHLL